MRTIDLDFSPLYRSVIGFDRVAHLLEGMSNNQNTKQGGYPPYNIELLAENQYRITMAVAGFSEDELDIESRENVLVVQGKKQADDTERQYLHQGIAERNFERKFQLADYVKVTGAQMDNGLLHIELEREIPEAMKPRKISISGQRMLEAEAE
ncbi:heat-shock protein [Endozoicomonas montiporae]|uniref:Heat-shock protein n=2 Tax=Endozoicomonas montiporae TaxID=1027273 RepID=A0A081N5F2_9GAMM|nr:Hsp20 family protein [Endozoicomonas montiporae]AMO57441.1 small heat shock protein IbpA [Endozoicomonas montiporae CL-33]KEQ13675.1 heat-shock protein [Endozoicomonas montiporae]